MFDVEVEVAGFVMMVSGRGSAVVDDNIDGRARRNLGDSSDNERIQELDLSFQGSGQNFPSSDPRRADGWDASCLGWRIVEGLRLRMRQKKNALRH